VILKYKFVLFFPPESATSVPKLCKVIQRQERKFETKLFLTFLFYYLIFFYMESVRS